MSRWRLGVATQVAGSYAANPKVAAVIAGGSIARGHADRYSDIDLGVFWEEEPSEDDRSRAVQQVDADLLRLYDYDPDEAVWSDDFMIGRDGSGLPRTGILVEVSN